MANRLNSRESRGPVSAAGKEKSSQNAVQHGLLSTSTTVLSWEDPAQLAEFQVRMEAELKPVGPLENAFAEQIVGALWKLRRLNHYESDVTEYHYLYIREQQENQKAADLERRKDQYADRLMQPTITDRAQYAQHQAEARQIAELRQDLLPTIGAAFIADVSGPDALGKLRRYQTSIENAMFRALHELQRLQAVRQGSALAVPAAMDIGVTVSNTDDVAEDNS